MGDYYKQMMEGGNSYTPQQVKDRAAEYVDPNMIQGMKDTNSQMLKQTFSGLDTSAGNSGNMGSSRTGLAQASAANGASNNLNTQLLDYQNQQIDRASSELGAENASKMEGLQGYGDMLGMKSKLDYANQNSDWDQLAKYANLAGGIGGMGGSSTGSQSGQSKAVSGGVGFSFSDETLKKDVKKVGEVDIKGSDKKVGKYEYEATDEGKSMGMPDGKQTGVLAQEVSDVKPSAVKRVAGKLSVDYDEVENLEKPKKKKKKKSSKKGGE
jgi:hypothetical protein